VEYAIEKEPLGTGGAIQLAVEKAREKDLLILNGDTIFKIDLPVLTSFHEDNASACTLALKPMKDFERYGVVEINEEGLITRFKEKKHYQEGLINGGAYLLNVGRFRQQKRPSVFSFEKDYLERCYTFMPMYGCVQEGYFIDIGIPEDFEKAQTDLA